MNIGLVLSGGMAKGAYQIGALKAINNFIPRDEIKYISCASVGVLNGYAYATGDLEHAEMLWKKICNNGSRFFINQILKSSLLQNSIGSLYDENRSLESKFFCSLLDINGRNVVYKDLSSVERSKIPSYLKASVAMPIYNKAVYLDNTAYFDGAMVDNIPLYPLLKYKPDYIICIHFDDVCYKFENASVNKRVINITFPTENRLKQSILFEQDSIDDMIKSGYERTMHLLKSIFYNGYEDIEYIYETIDYMNRSNSNTKLRITGDVLVTNLNKVMQKLTRRKIL